jgi:tetratricopeptide (TPR) repeat protein
VTPVRSEASFSLRRVQDMLGLSRTIVTGLVSAGFVAPTRGPRNEYRFSFQDLMLLRTAFALQQAHVPPRKILRSLTRLKAQLPAELPLTGLRITAVGAEVAVRDRSAQWQAESGQLLMDFEVADVSGSVAILPASPGAPRPAQVDWYAEGVQLEASDPAAAEAAYRRAIEQDPGASAPYLNLGAMLCEQGRCVDAVTLYESAEGLVDDEPLIHFNHAIALEDLGKVQEAIAAYTRALGADPELADGHYNLAMLLDARGDAQGALRHFSAYRRLARAEHT